jgi:nitrogen fixation/metabolism regulation signal transduction histidine kinase
MSTSDVMSAGARPHKRRLRNYLLDVGLQVRYTAFIVVVAIFLTALLGYKIYDATRESSNIIAQSIKMTQLIDQASGDELAAQFRSNDRTVLYSIAGFGVVLVFSIFGAGIWITHKVAGPLYSIAAICRRVRDNNLAPSLRQLRKGDELQEFYSSFRDMYETLRSRISSDVQVLASAIAALESATPRSAHMEQVLLELRQLRKEKEQSLDPHAAAQTGEPA